MQLTWNRTWSWYCFFVSFARAIEIRPKSLLFLHPDIFVSYRNFFLLSLIDVLRVGSECSIVSFFVRVVIFPLLQRFSSIQFVIFDRGIRLFSFIIVNIVRSKGFVWMGSTFERNGNFSFMNHTLMRIVDPTFFFWISLIWITAKKMPNTYATITFFHVIRIHFFQASFHFTIFISSIISLIIKLLHMLKFWVLY